MTADGAAAEAGRDFIRDIIQADLDAGVVDQLGQRLLHLGHLFARQNAAIDIGPRPLRQALGLQTESDSISGRVGQIHEPIGEAEHE